MTGELPSNQKAVFRSRYLPVFVASIGIYLALEVLLNPRRISLEGLSIAVLAIAVVAAIAVACFTVTVLPDGVRGSTKYGAFKLLRWDEIAYVTPVSMFGLQHVKLIPAKGAAVWLPLYLNKWDQFSRIAAANIQDENNPFKAFLKKGTDPGESAARKIRNAWIVGSIWAIITFVLAVASLFNPALTGVDAWSLLDFAIILGLTYGVYRKSRVCAGLLLSLIILEEVMSWYEAGSVARLVVTLFFIWFFAQGVKGTIEFHRLARQKSTG